MKLFSTAAALAMMGFLLLGDASAQMVDIGMGRMEKSEFLALKAMVQGETATTQHVVSTPPKETDRYGWIEMPRQEFEALRNRMAGISRAGEETGNVTKTVQMVDIGTGAMSREEFEALKQKVAENRSPLLDWVAAAYR